MSKAAAKAVHYPTFALPTPFDRRDNVDYGALRAHLAMLTHLGSPTIVTNGTTGEFCSLTQAERKLILGRCRKHFTGRIIAHIGSSCLRDSLHLLEHAQDFADALLILPPYYYSDAGVQGITDFFSVLIEKATIPVYLYNFPKHTGIQLSIDMVTDLATRYELVQGIKDSSNDIQLSVAIKESVAGFEVFTGNETQGLAALQKGLTGVIAGGGNPLPEILIGITQAFDSGAFGYASQLQQIFDKWGLDRKQSGLNAISAAKAGLATRLPHYPSRVRPPLTSATGELTMTLGHLLAELLESYGHCRLPQK